MSARSLWFGPGVFAVLVRGREKLRRALDSFGAWSLVLLFSSLQANSQPLADLFSGTNLLRIDIVVPEAGMAALRSYNWDSAHPNPTDRPYALARVNARGNVFTNVAVHLKGSFGSFRPVDNFPGLTLNFDKFAPGQEFAGLHKLSLNNSAQDPTCLHEMLCCDLFAAAGVPVTRVTHAFVTLNGRKLGVYVLTEGFGKHFLKRYFKKANGTLFDAGYLQDIDRPEGVRVDFGTGPDGLTALRRLLFAARESDPAQRFSKIEQVLDVDRFISMMAFEVILCHWDSYSMNRNNYRIYYDTGSSKLIFIPHGMDQVLGIDRRNLDLPVLPPMEGVVSRALVSTPEGRRRYLARLDDLFRRLFNPEELRRHLQEVDARIGAEFREPQGRWPVRGRDRPTWVMSSGDHARDVEDLCRRISTRAASLRQQLSQLRADIDHR